MLQNELRKSQTALQYFLFVNSIQFSYNKIIERNFLFFKLQKEQLLIHLIRNFKYKYLIVFIISWKYINRFLILTFACFSSYYNIVLLKRINFQISKIFVNCIIEWCPFEASFPNWRKQFSICKFLYFITLNFIFFEKSCNLFLLICF